MSATTWELYNEYLKGIPNLKLPLVKTEISENIYWVYAILVDEKFATAIEIMHKLKF